LETSFDSGRGRISFWLIAAILFSVVFKIGTPVAISDNENGNLKNPQVQIISLSADSPAKAAGLQPGDTIVSVEMETVIK
jgi:C-terminal processing protease CtpA/Prc